jgi:hypothetical protein
MAPDAMKRGDLSKVSTGPALAKPMANAASGLVASLRAATPMLRDETKNARASSSEISNALATESAVSSKTFLSSRSDVSRYSTCLKSTSSLGKLCTSISSSESRGIAADIDSAELPEKNSKYAPTALVVRNTSSTPTSPTISSARPPFFFSPGTVVLRPPL